MVSASRRSDILAFHTDWLLKRLREGFCEVSNPFNARTYRVSLRRQDVLCLVFWTRNPLPLLKRFSEFDRLSIPAYALMTLTGYGAPLERSSPPVETALEAFRQLSSRLGPRFTHWRYDPVILTDRVPWSEQRARFERLAGRLEGLTGRCYISFMQLYRKTVRALEAVALKHDFHYGYREAGSSVSGQPARGRPLRIGDMRDKTLELAEIVARHGMRLYACCQGELADAKHNVWPSSCIDSELVGALAGNAGLRVPPSPSRPGCGCGASKDIGTYDTCRHGCVYCYATRPGVKPRRLN
ncbi:MAG: DUF1848 domain-containing protein [Acidobacteriota bacterium]